MNNIEFNESEEREFEHDTFPLVSEQISTIPISGEDSIVELRIKLKKCEDRYERVKKERDELHQHTVDLTTQIDQLRQEKNRFIEIIDNKDSEIQRLQNENEKLVGDIEECHAIAENLRKIIQEQNKTIIEQANTIQKCEVEKKDLKDKIEVLERNNEDLERFLKSQEEKYEILIKELKEDLHNCREENNRIKSELDTCQEALDKWIREKEKLEQTIRELREKISSCRNLLIKIRDLSNEVNALLDTLHIENHLDTEPQRDPFTQTDFSRQSEGDIELHQFSIEGKPEQSGNDDATYPWEKGHDEREFIQF